MGKAEKILAGALARAEGGVPVCLSPAPGEVFCSCTKREGRAALWELAIGGKSAAWRLCADGAVYFNTDAAGKSVLKWARRMNAIAEACCLDFLRFTGEQDAYGRTFAWVGGKRICLRLSCIYRAEDGRLEAVCSAFDARLEESWTGLEEHEKKLDEGKEEKDEN